MTWTKDEIQQARTRPLAPTLTQRGYQLVELPSGALIVPAIKGLVILRHTWYWAPQNLKGNTIDFFMTFEAKTFTDTMKILCPKDASHTACGGKGAPTATQAKDQRHRRAGPGHHPEPGDEDDKQ